LIMISYGKQSIDRSDVKAVTDALSTDWLTQGPEVEVFEKGITDYFGAKHTCAVANGTAALHLAGLALGWQPADIVITSPITFLSTATSIVFAGARPDFVDIDPVSYNIDPNLVEKRVKKYRAAGKEVKAIVGVDYAGHPCHWEALRAIADKYDIQLMNDNCHALGAAYFDDKQYAVKYADVVTQSYHPVKHITTGEGGAVLTNNAAIDEKVRRLRSHGMTKDPARLERHEGPWYYEMHELGYNYRISDFQCALGSSQLKRLDEFNKVRRGIARLYDQKFSYTDCFEVPRIDETVECAYHLYPLRIDFDKFPISKIALFKRMKEFGINLQVHYIPVHLQPFFGKRFGFKYGDCPVAEQFYKQEISLPIYPALPINSVDFVGEKLLQIALS
jgi:UDP-4-amino-4,6-dideoxy-N-acetyl-beta-L-altrosamine transaminase